MEEEGQTKYPDAMMSTLSPVSQRVCLLRLLNSDSCSVVGSMRVLASSLFFRLNFLPHRKTAERDV